MSLRIAVQMDPLEAVNPAGDTTFMMIEEAQARGHSVFVYGVGDLFYNSGFVGHGQSPRKSSPAARRMPRWALPGGLICAATPMWS